VYGGEVCFRRDRFELIEAGTTILPPFRPSDRQPPADWADVPRGGVWARLRDRHGAHTIATFSLHMTHRSNAVQLDSVDAIAAWAAGLPHGTAVVISGDFNADPGSNVYERLLAGVPGLRDARTQTPQDEPPTPRPPLIDWVLYTPPLAPLRYCVIDCRDAGIRASDHPAVCVEFATDTGRG